MDNRSLPVTVTNSAEGVQHQGDLSGWVEYLGSPPWAARLLRGSVCYVTPHTGPPKWVLRLLPYLAGGDAEA